MSEKVELVTFRYITPDDIDAIIKIESLNHFFSDGEGMKKDNRQFNRKDLLDFIAGDRTRVKVAEINEEIVGFYLFDASIDVKARLHRLSVKDKRKKIGTLLLKDFFELAQKAGCEEVSAYVYEDDNAATAFFSKILKDYKSKVIRNHLDPFEKKWNAIEFTKKVEE